MRILFVTTTVLLASADFTCAQVVQLPSYRFFQLSTSVLVPDHGSVTAGGVSYASDYRATRGGLFPTQRVMGSSRSASSVQISAQIIDHRELDAAVLAEAERRRGRPRAGFDTQRANTLKRQIAADHPASRPAQPSLQARASEEIEGLLRKGDKSRDQGQYGAARIFYRTAMRQSDGALRDEAMQRLASLSQLQARR